MSFALFEYQREALSAVLSDYEAGFRRLCLALATGAGKTFTTVKTVEAFCARHALVDPHVLFVAPRAELVDQTIETLQRHLPAVSVGRIQGAGSQFGRQWSVATLQSAVSRKRLRRLKDRAYHVVVIDEVHFATTGSVAQVMDACADDATLVLGLTATPNRADGIGLAEAGFERIAYNYPLPRAIEEGYLVDIRGISVDLGLDLDACKVDPKTGDFQKASLAEVMGTETAVAATVQAWLDHAEGRKTIGFGVTIDQIERIAAELRRRGVAAACVSERTPKDECKRLYAELRSGALRWLGSVTKLTAGVEDDSIACVHLARPTSSQGLYIQMVGRGARVPRTPSLAEGKTDCLLLDVTGTSSRLPLVSPALLAGLPPREPDDTEPRERGIVEMREGAVTRTPSLLAAYRAARSVDLFAVPRGRRYDWTQTPHGHALSLGKAGMFLVAPHRSDDDRRRGLWRIVHVQWLRDTPGAPARHPGALRAQEMARVEYVAEGLTALDAIGLCEVDAQRFAPKRRGGPGASIGGASPDEVQQAIEDMKNRHAALERAAGHKLAPGAIVAAPPALVRHLQRQRALTERQARALTQQEAAELLQGREPAQLGGAA